MNKILHINVGGYPFSIDIDAYEKLDHYLATLEQHFSKSEGCKEIMHDIESRMGELFKEGINGGSIVTLPLVEKCIGIMGTADNFTSDAEHDFKSDTHESNPGTKDGWGIKTGKKLFRDMENAKFMGVCSGIAQYFGIQDVVWVRLAFALGVLGGGFTVPLYLILWMIVPEARTSADRLNMAGKPINVQNIARKAEEELDKLTDKFEDWRESKRKRKKKWYQNKY